MKKNNKKSLLLDKKLAKLKAESSVLYLLKYIGEDSDRIGLTQTPTRVVNFFEEFFSGYHINPKQLLQETIQVESQNQMVLLKDIKFTSFCEHHLLPFYGKAHIAYLPNKKLAGIGRIEKLVEAFSRRLQIQERLTSEIINTMNEMLQPKGLSIVLEAFHLCIHLKSRGEPKLITVESRGAFEKDAELRSEFLRLIKTTS